MKMPGKPRKKLELLRDRREVARLSLKGLSQDEIAIELGLSQATVSRDLKAVRDQWSQKALRDIEEAKAQILAELAEVRREAWEAWERSKRDIEVKTSEMSFGEEAEGEGRPATLQKQVEKIEGRNPDPMYLKRIHESLSSQSKILGIETNVHKLTGFDGGPIQISEVRKRVAGRIAGIAERISAPDDSC